MTHHDTAPARLRPPTTVDHVATIGFGGIPEDARKYVHTALHIVRRANADIGYQFVNDFKPGASLAAIDTVNGHGYLILSEQQRYPHPHLGHERMPLDRAATLGMIGRVGLELPSGGVEEDETPVQTAIREAREEAGLVDLSEEQLIPLIIGAKSSISTNNQEFNIFATLLQDGQWQPHEVAPDAEEGMIAVGAYRLDTAVEELISQGHVWDLSTIAAINSLWRIKKFRKYL